MPISRADVEHVARLARLALTDEEKDEMRASDPRVRAILERTEALSEDELARRRARLPEASVFVLCRSMAAHSSGRPSPANPDMVFTGGAQWRILLMLMANSLVSAGICTWSCVSTHEPCSRSSVNSGITRFANSSRLSQMCSWRLGPACSTKITWSTPTAS